MKYHFAGKEKKLSIGVYPDVSLADARAKRDDARKLLVEGNDPAEQKKQVTFYFKAKTNDIMLGVVYRF